MCAMTSNPGAKYLQHLQADGKPVFLHVADMVRSFEKATTGSTGYSSVGIVAGATYPNEALQLRKALPNSFFLVPGIGSQGGDNETLSHFFDSKGMGAIVNSSRGIIYPGESTDETTLALLIREAANQLNQAVNSARSK